MESHIDPLDLMARGVNHGDKHVIELTDTVLDVHEWTGDPAVLVAATRSADLISTPWQPQHDPTQ